MIENHTLGVHEEDCALVVLERVKIQLAGRQSREAQVSRPEVGIGRGCVIEAGVRGIAENKRIIAHVDFPAAPRNRCRRGIEEPRQLDILCLVELHAEAGRPTLDQIPLIGLLHHPGNPEPHPVFILIPIERPAELRVIEGDLARLDNVVAVGHTGHPHASLEQLVARLHLIEFLRLHKGVALRIVEYVTNQAPEDIFTRTSIPYCQNW